MSTKFDAAKKVAGWCSDQQNQAPGTQGLEVPGAQENANRRATGDSAIDWIDHSAKPCWQLKESLSRDCSETCVRRHYRYAQAHALATTSISKT